MEEKNKTNIFIDKRTISFAVLQREVELIESFSTLISIMRYGDHKFNYEKVQKEQEFDKVTRILMEIIDFMENNKIQELKDEYNVEYQNIKNFQNKMKDISKPEITYNDLLSAYDSIRLFISRSGYHQDQYIENGIDDDLEFADI